MAEAEQSDKTTPAPHRRQYYQSRPGTSYRGRGRANASVSKALHLFGVRDLREILDRKHQDEEESKSGPPPDPSYNYLKDPSRENANEYQNRYHKERTSGDVYPRGHNFRGYRGRGRGSYTFRENRQHEPEKSSFIQNPTNIRVELIASTGERSCQLDEETKIADIKRIPNYKLKDMRPRNEDVAVVEKDFNDKYRNERGRGRGYRGRRGRGRGRGDRGRGRGRGRYPNRNNNENGQPQQQTTDENTSEENRDTECAATSVTDEEEKENEENYEEHITEDQEHEDEYQEQYYEGEEYSEASEQNQSLDEAIGQDDTKLDENLVITSSEKRSVKFKLDDKQNDQAAKQELKNDEKGVGKECSQKEQNKKRDK